MPLRLTPFENLLARFNVLPVPLFDAPLAPGLAKMLVTACELNLFDTLGRRHLTLIELAQSLDCHPQGLQLLLQILVSANYLRYRHGTYANTAMARRWLTSASRVNIAPYIIHSPDIVDIWDHVAEVVKTHQQAMRMPYEEDASNPEMGRLLARHYAGLASLAGILGGEIIVRAPISGKVERLLDIGGSHAGFSVLFSRRYRQLQSTVLDIQAGIDAGQLTVKRAKLEQRIHFTRADIVKDDFPTLFEQPFDVALYFHIAHLLPPEMNAAVLAKVVRTLRPGGTLIFVDQIVDQTHNSQLTSLMVGLMALTMTTVGGTCYPFSTIQSWLEQAGMENVRSHRLLTPGAMLVTATKVG